MWSRILSFFLTASSLAAMLPLAARAAAEGEDERLFAPMGDWSLQRRPDHCVLARNFGSEDRPLQLRIQKFPPYDMHEISVLGRDVTLRRSGTIEASFEPLPPFLVVDEPYAMSSSIGNGVMFRANIKFRAGDDVPALDEEASDARRQEIYPQSGIFKLDGIVRDAVRLQTGSMEAPLERLDACVHGLAKSWGVDLQVTRSAPQQKNYEEWAAAIAREYPMSARFRGQQGRVSAILVIDQTGEPERCFTKVPVRDTTLQDNSCELLLRLAEYSPARDQYGTPVKGIAQVDIRYVLN